MGSDREKILIVDDLAANLTALQVTLEPLSHDIVSARSGEEALRHLLHDDYACILLDVDMPGTDGFETAALIRQRHKNRTTPIVFVTAMSTDDASIMKGYAQGAVDYVVKPYNPELMRAKVRVLVELHQRERRLRDQERRLMEAHVAAERERLGAERAAMRAFWSESPLPICALDGPDFRFAFANPAYEGLVGVRDLIGKRLTEALPLFRDTPFGGLLKQVALTGQPLISRNVPLPREGGTTEHFDFIFQPRHGLDGRVEGILVCGNRATDRIAPRKASEDGGER